MRAYLLLREEYPLSIPYTERIENGYQFHGPVSNFDGIGRFVLGLMDEIQIKAPDLFKTFIENKFHHQGLLGSKWIAAKANDSKPACRLLPAGNNQHSINIVQ